MQHDYESLRREVEELKAEVARLKGEPEETSQEFMGRLEGARRHDSPLPSSAAADFAHQRAEEDKAAEAIRKAGGEPSDYNMDQFCNALHNLKWLDKRFQTRLEGYAKRMREENQMGSAAPSYAD